MTEFLQVWLSWKESLSSSSSASGSPSPIRPITTGQDLQDKRDFPIRAQTAILRMQRYMVIQHGAIMMKPMVV